MESNIYKQVVHNSPTGYAYHKIICNEQGDAVDYVFLDTNNSFEQYTGLKSEDVIGKKVSEVLPEIKNDKIDWIYEHGKVALGGEEKEFEQYSVTLKRFFRIKIFSPEKNYFISLFNDITLEKEVEMREIESLNKFKKYIDNAPYGVFVTDQYGYYLEVNQEACNMTGYTENELVGMTLIDLIAVDDKQAVIDNFDSIKRSKDAKPQKTETGFITKQGENRFWSVNALKLNDTTFLVFTEDITKDINQKRKNEQTKLETKALFDHAGLGIEYYNPDGYVIWFNEIAAKNMGGIPEDFEGKSFSEIYSQNEASKYIERLKASIISDISLEYEDHIDLADRSVYFRRTYNCIYDSDNILLGVEIISQDITDLRHREIELIRSREDFKIMFEDAPLAYQALDVDGRFISINKAWLEMLDYQEDEVVGKWLGEFVSPNYIDRFKKHFPEFMRGDSNNAVFEMVNKKGEIRTINLSCRIGYEASGDFRQIHCILQDITEQLKVENRLKRQEEEQRSILKQLQVGIIVHAADSSVVFSNSLAEKILGISSKELKGKVAVDSAWNFIDQEEKILPLDEYPVSIVINNKKPIENYVVGIKSSSSDSIKWVVVNGHPIFEDDKLQRVIISFIDITQNKKNEEELIKNHIAHKAMIANISDVIGILGKDGTIKYKSPNITKYFGWTPEELIGKDSLINVHPQDKAFVSAKFDDLLKNPNEVKEIEYRYLCKDLSVKIVRLFAVNLVDDENINGVLINFLDVTKRRNREKEREMIDNRLNQQQRLESIGTLAGGVAHEINNPINGIMNYSQLIKDISDPDSEAVEYANEILYETDRVSTIVKNLLQFSRNEKQEHSYADAQDIINNTTSLIKTIMKHDQIDLEIDIPEYLPKIKCRSQQIQQVIMNLLTNARDTLNEKYPEYNEDKVIKLYCNHYVKNRFKWIRITIEDHGKGIAKSLQPTIFNPFFTTKERDKGIGLGLSISHGIVKDHNGTLTFETEEGKYTKFFIDLPCDNGWDNA